MTENKWSYQESVQDKNRSDEDSRRVELVDLLVGKLYPFEVDASIKSRSGNLDIVVTRHTDRATVRYPVSLDAIDLVDRVVLVNSVADLVIAMLDRLPDASIVVDKEESSDDEEALESELDEE